MFQKAFLLLAFPLCCCRALAQQPPADAYPRVTGYVSVIHPIVTVDDKSTIYNFSGAYTVGFPMGLNLLKSSRIGFSFEMAPFIKAENGSSKVAFLLFHPGVIARLKKGYSYITRLAFESTGRYGITPVINKVVFKQKAINYFAALSTPFRTGNDKPSSIGLALQLGMVF